MLTVTKEFTWDCAHMLYGHAGLCQNVHGHTYKMHVEVAHPVGVVIDAGPTEGMVIDFKELKSVVKETLVDQLDHAFVTSGDESQTKEAIITNTIDSLGMKIYTLGCRPTAENMAVEFYKDLKRAFADRGVNVRLCSVTIWETPTSFAKYAE